MSEHQFESGEWVRIKSAEQILPTLDKQGCCSGMPFMPEMVHHCGKVYRIGKVANNVCFANKSRALGGNVVLHGPPRCSGEAHGHCQFGCNFFWRMEWLEKAEQSSTRGNITIDQNDSAIYKLIDLTRSFTRTVDQNGKTRYSCQATILKNRAKHVSFTQLKQYRDARNQNGESLFRLLNFWTYAIRKKLFAINDSITGSCTGRTPIAKLDLQVGESVRVKQLDQIRTTLDKSGCNRGLWFDREEMGRYCGMNMIVSRRIARVIDEQTGRLIDLKVPSVVLSESACSGVFRRFCSRGMLFMWRECWLERI